MPIDHRSRLAILWQNEHFPDPVKGGGGAVNTRYIVGALRASGHEAVVLARGAKAGDPHEEVDGIPIVRVAPPAVPARLWPVFPLLEPGRVRARVAPLAARFDAFVCVDAAYALAIKRAQPQRPLLYRVEGTPRGYDAAVPPAAPPPRRSLAHGKREAIERLLARENELMDRWAWRRADALVVKSRFMKRDLVDLYGVGAGRIHVVPNGVDFPRYAEAKRSRENRALIGATDEATMVVAFCGRLVRMKNLGYLLRGFARMRGRDRCVLLVVGEGEERAALQAEADALGIRTRTHFVGHVDNVQDWLAASDVFVLPSTYEPFGNALIEAMATGLACVALRPDHLAVRTASDDILEDGESGLLVDHRSAEDLAQALDLMAEQRERRLSLGRAAQSRCRNLYSWNACAARYLDVLRLPVSCASPGRGTDR
jgi:glycosyltransferase involved in cell wall biosynthesis